MNSAQSGSILGKGKYDFGPFKLFEKRIFLPCFFLLFWGCQTANEIRTDHPITAIKAKLIYVGNGSVIENGIIIISNGKIVDIGDSLLNIPKHAVILDYSDKYIMPGMIDAHVHINASGFFDTRPMNLDIQDTISYATAQTNLKNEIDVIMANYLARGITGIYDMGGFDWSLELQDECETNLSYPHLSASGTILTPYPGLLELNLNDDTTVVLMNESDLLDKTLKSNHAKGAKGIKIIGINQDDQYLNALETVVKYKNEFDLDLLIHAQYLDQANIAIQYDPDIFVHSISDEKISKDLLDKMKDREVIYIPTLMVRRGYYDIYKAIMGDTLIDFDSDQMASRHIQNAVSFRKFANTTYIKNQINILGRSLPPRDSINFHNLKKVHQAGIVVAVGTDAGNPGTLHGLAYLKELCSMQDAGIPAKEIIVMASKNGAQAMRRLNDFGTLEDNKMANLIVLGKDPGEDIAHIESIEFVMKVGVIKSPQEILNH